MERKLCGHEKRKLKVVDKVFTKPPKPFTCMTPWKQGTVTGIHSPLHIEVDSTPYHVSHVRRNPANHDGGSTIPDRDLGATPIGGGERFNSDKHELSAVERQKEDSESVEEEDDDEERTDEAVRPRRERRPPRWLVDYVSACLLYTSPSPRDLSTSRMPSSA